MERFFENNEFHQWGLANRGLANNKYLTHFKNGSRSPKRPRPNPLVHLSTFGRVSDAGPAPAFAAAKSK